MTEQEIIQNCYECKDCESLLDHIDHCQFLFVGAKDYVETRNLLLSLRKKLITIAEDKI